MAGLQRRGLSLYRVAEDHLTFSSIVVGPIIILGLQLALYSFSCVLIRTALRELKNKNMKPREYRFHRVSLLTLFTLASVNIPNSMVKVIGWSAYGFYTLQGAEFSNSAVVGNVLLKRVRVQFDYIVFSEVRVRFVPAMRSDDLNESSIFADAILIFRCYSIWGFRLKVVIGPIIGCIAVDGIVALGLQIAQGSDVQWFIYTQFGIGTYLVGNAVMNILLTFMIAGRIWWISRRTKGVLSEVYLQRYKFIILLTLESGFLFAAVLICNIFFNVTPSLYGWDLMPLLVQVAGIAPTLIIVRAGKSTGRHATNDAGVEVENTS